MDHNSTHNRHLPAPHLLGVTAFHIILFLAGTALGTSHPFMIVRESQYEALQARASQSPWKEMKSSAISQAKSLSVPTSINVGSHQSSYSFKDKVSVLSLAYVLDVSGRSQYVSKLNSALRLWHGVHASLRTVPNLGLVWEHTSPVAAAYVQSVLALDIVHDDLSHSNRQYIEEGLRKTADLYRNPTLLNGCGGKVERCAVLGENLPGILGSWAIYKEDTAEIVRQKENYHKVFPNLLSDDGYYGGGGLYGALGFGDEHCLAKTHFMDILEFTGIDHSYYGNPKLAGFFEWLYGYAFGPFGKSVCLGDVGQTNGPYAGASAMTRASQFSGLAAQYASYRNGGTSFPASLLRYVLLQNRLPNPVKPTSRVWPSDHASFWERNSNPKSLMGAMVNSTKLHGHSHKEVNAIYLAAYGEHVLVNSGYAGFGNSVLGYPWIYTHESAYSGNTVMIEYYDHLTKTGGGMSEHILAPTFDYVSGTSGPALQFGHHQRNFCFVHPQDGQNGYFVLFDEVQIEKSEGPIFMALHPNASNLTTVTKGTEYMSKIGPVRFGGKDVRLSVFLGTPPNKVEIKRGAIASFGSSFEGRYLFPHFAPDAQSRKNMVTVLYPHDATHKKANMERFVGTGYSGAKIIMPAVEDIALEISAPGKISLPDASIQAKCVLYRKQSKGVAFYFARQATLLGFNQGLPVGFKSDKPISVFLRKGKGKIVSAGARVTLYHSGIHFVVCGGKSLTPIAKGKDWMQVEIPAGTHEIGLHTTSLGPEAAVAGSGKPSGYSIRNGAVHFAVPLKVPTKIQVSVFEAKGRQIWESQKTGVRGANCIVWPQSSSSTPGPGVYFVCLEIAGKRRQIIKHVIH